MFLSSFFVFNYHLYSNSKVANRFPKKRKLKVVIFHLPQRVPKLKGHHSEPSKEESKVIRTILNENKSKTRCKQGIIGIGRKVSIQ